MRSWRDEHTPSRLMTVGLLADGAEKNRHTAVFVEAEKAGPRSTSLHGQRRFLNLFDGADFDFGVCRVFDFFRFIQKRLKQFAGNVVRLVEYADLLLDFLVVVLWCASRSRYTSARFLHSQIIAD